MKKIRKKNPLSAEKVIRSDKEAVKKSIFEWALFVFLLVIVLVTVFSTVLRVTPIKLSVGEEVCDITVVVSRFQYTAQRNDPVVFKVDGVFTAGYVIARENSEIHLGTGKSGEIDHLIYNGASYFSADELKEALPDGKVPDGYVLLTKDLSMDSRYRVGILVSENDIYGRMDWVLYPFSLLGRDAGYYKV